MKDVFQIILAGRSVSELLPAIADVDVESVAKQALSLSDEQGDFVAEWLTRNLRRLGVRSTLYAGAIFYIAKELDQARGGSSILEKLSSEVGVSRTQAYRAIQVFEIFNPIFVGNGKLIDLFVSESLKILAEDKTHADARSEAIRKAKSGTKITIRLAKGLQSQFLQQEEEIPNSITGRAPEEPQGDGNTQESKPFVQTSVSRIGSRLAEPEEAADSGTNETAVVHRAETNPAEPVLFEGFGFRLVVDPEFADRCDSQLERIIAGLEQFITQLRSEILPVKENQ